MFNILNKISKGNSSTYISKISYLVIDKLVKLISDIIIGGLIARHFSPSYFGKWQYILSFVLLFNVISPGGLVNSVILKELQINQDKSSLLINTIYTKFIFAIISIFVCVISISLFEPFSVNNLYTQLCLIFVIPFLFQSIDTIDYYYQYIEKPQKPVQIRIYCTLIFIIIKLLLLYTNSNIILFACVYTIEICTYYISLLFVFKNEFVQRNTIISWKINTEIIKSLIKKGFPLLVSSIFVTIYFKIDQLMIKNILGDIDVGLYAAAARISEIWYAFPGIIITIMLPKLIQSRDKDIKSYKDIVKVIYILLISVSIIISIAINTFSSEVISYIYGQSYAKSSKVLSIHIWSGIFVFISAFNSTILVIENNSKFLLIITLVNVIINVTSNLILLPRVGITGSAYAILFSYLFSVITFIAIQQKFIKV